MLKTQNGVSPNQPKWTILSILSFSFKLHANLWHTVNVFYFLSAHFVIGAVVRLLWLKTSQIAKFMGPTWGPPGSCRPQMGPMLAPWTLLSGLGAWPRASLPLGERRDLGCPLPLCERSSPHLEEGRSRPLGERYKNALQITVKLHHVIPLHYYRNQHTVHTILVIFESLLRIRRYFCPFSMISITKVKYQL